jgi:O-succinylbenzoic acid--CoA ligase
MVPLQVQHSLDKLTQIKKLIIGGAKVNASLSKELLEFQLRFMKLME